MSTREVIDLRLSGQHEVGMTIMHNTTDTKLLQRPAPNNWNIFEHFVHLVRYQNNFLDRVKFILTSNNPSIERYSAEKDPEFKQWLDRDKEWLTHRLVNDRFSAYNQFLEFSEEELKRTGTHPVFGELSLLDWYEFFVLHEAHHLHAMWKLSKRRF